jgi:hypothetical protein
VIVVAIPTDLVISGRNPDRLDPDNLLVGWFSAQGTESKQPTAWAKVVDLLFDASTPLDTEPSPE